MISELSGEQLSLIPAFQDKWKAISLQTHPLNIYKARSTVRSVYDLMGKNDPKLLYFKSPYHLKRTIFEKSPQVLAEELGAPLLMMPFSFDLLGEIRDQLTENCWIFLQEEWEKSEQENQRLWIPITAIFQQLQAEINLYEWQRLNQLQDELRQQLTQSLWNYQTEKLRKDVLQTIGGELLLEIGELFWGNIAEPLWKNIAEPLLNSTLSSPLFEEIKEDFQKSIDPWLHLVDGIGFGYSILRPTIDASYTALIDYCINVLHCHSHREKWTALQSLVYDCGWIIPFEKTCVICDRPTELHFDPQSRLHAEGHPAMLFNDNYGIYAYQGVILPEKYGRLHPHQWQSYWLLTETNAELRRVLIQGIGYGRICQELNAVTLDIWREYTLLRIDQEVDIEPIFLLKMTCPSTGHIHVIRVPPEMRSAREAIRWVNWGTDPDEFSIAT